MRVHRLAVSAFGPFSGTEEVDFDDLNAAGLFLLTGPTGAGKTSLLDAICFGLYGSVPGVRGVKALKSQHAPPDATPEVVLEFSVRDRRFRVRRSPAWTRPKLRGGGTTEQPASATLVELTSGEEHFLSSRAQEVGHLVGDLMGMSASQFSQVALLPQGEFATFLRASSQERHDVLQQLFQTERFSRIESWVHEHSRHLERRSAEQERAVQRIVDTIAGRVGVELPEQLAGPEPGRLSCDPRLTDWASELLQRCRERLASAEQEDWESEAATEEIRAVHETAKQHAIDATRRAEARRILSGLDQSSQAADEAEQALRADVRAARCSALLALVDDADRRRDDARTSLRHRSLHELLPDGAAVSATALAEQERVVRTNLDRLDTLLPREQERLEARARLSRAETECDALRARITGSTRRADELPAVCARLRAEVADTTARALRHDSLAAELATVRRRLTAARRLPALREALAAAQEHRREATDRSQAARERALELAARRLDEIAGELAGHLVDGRPCQVCGAVEHPAKAALADDAVTEQEQQDAAALEESTARERTRSERALADAQRELEVCQEAAAGLDDSSGATLESQLTEQLADAAAARSAIGGLERRLSETEDELDLVSRRLRADETALAAAEQQCSAAQAIVVAATRDLAAVLPEDRPDVRLDVLHEEQQVLLQRLQAARAASEELDRASTQLEERTAHAMAATRQEGFASLEEARSALLETVRREELQLLVEERARHRSRAEAVLDELGAAPGSSPGDVDELGARLAEAEKRRETARRIRYECESVVVSLTQLHGRLVESLGSWAPLRAESGRAEAMSKLVRGMGGDNHRQVRLSAYVLATRLDQVVAAANERLGLMRDQRYLLERSGRLTRKGSQAGLGLDVIDAWTGDVRDPVTLSGGETFVVSLSLALGLADVVTQEAGGTEVETLFVDEGFGTLDPETLDDVMDRIDGLREGGRTVGLVSHVSELRNRIPTQLHVDKRRTGSTVAIRNAVA